LWLNAMEVSLQGMLDNAGVIESDISRSNTALVDAILIEARDVSEAPTSSSAEGLEVPPVVARCAGVDDSKDLNGSDSIVFSKCIQPEAAAINEFNTVTVPTKAEQCGEEDEKESHECFVEGSSTKLGRSKQRLPGAGLFDDDDLEFVPLAITACLPSSCEPRTSGCINDSASPSSSVNTVSDSSAIPRITVLDVDLDDEDAFLPLVTLSPSIASMNAEGSDLKPQSGDGEKGAEVDDNLWLRVGGGLAIVGAIVGGAAAITMMHDNGPKDSKRPADEGQKR
jgi:hypothetical protein